MKPQGQIAFRPLALSWYKQGMAETSQRAKGQRLPHNYIILIRSKSWLQIRQLCWLVRLSPAGRPAKNSEVTSEKFIHPQQ